MKLAGVKAIQAVLSLFQAWRPVDHRWEWSEVNGMDRRTCADCGQTEELDPGTGFAGSAWQRVIEGDQTAHGDG